MTLPGLATSLPYLHVFVDPVYLVARDLARRCTKSLVNMLLLLLFFITGTCERALVPLDCGIESHFFCHVFDVRTVITTPWNRLAVLDLGRQFGPRIRTNFVMTTRLLINALYFSATRLFNCIVASSPTR